MVRGLKAPLFRVFFDVLVTALMLFSGAAAMAQSSSEAGALAVAQSLEKRGMLAEAAEAYQAALEHFPKSSQARLGEGRTLGALGRCAESNDVLRPLAATFRPGIEHLLGVCYFRTHQFDQAIVRLQAASELQPGSQEVWLDLARADLGAGRDHEAVSTLQAWLARNPRDPDALYWLGNVYNSMSQRTLDQMIARDPGNYHVLELEGDQLRQKQDYDGALQDYRKALKAAPDAPGLHFKVGDIYYLTLKYPEAREQLQQELTMNPDHARANYELGDMDIKHGRLDEGVAHLTRALKTDPALLDAHRSLGRALLAQKRNADAVQELLWVSKADPSDYTIHAMLASAYRQMGEAEKAREQAEIYQKLIQQNASGLERLKSEERQMNDQPAPTRNTDSPH